MSDSGEQSNTRDPIIETVEELTVSFAERVNKDRPITIKLDNVRPLEGQHNYNTWAAVMKIILKGMKVYEIVVDGAEPPNGSSAKEKAAYESLCNQASAVFIQVVSTDLLEKIIELEHPYKMWTYLRAEFYRDTAYAMVSQIMNLTNLSVTYDPSLPISQFISSFETEWLRLYKMAKSSKDDYRVLFAKFLEQDKAKRDFLLGFIVKHHSNVVDNLSTKDDLTFSDVKQRLLELDHQNTSSLPDQQALFAAKSSKKPYKKAVTTAPPPKINVETCSWCDKHRSDAPLKDRQHNWEACGPLKAFQAERKKNKKGRSEKALVTTGKDSDSVRRNSLFYFDTGATSHMCPLAERFESLQTCSGFVKSSSKASMAIKGKGTVVMDSVLNDGTISSFRVHDVLFVPELERPLLSWRKIKEKGYTMVGKGDLISIVKHNKILFEAVFDGSLFKIPEVNDAAFLTFDFWHSALGHLAPRSIEKAKELYGDASVIPKAPTNFHCPQCSLSKITHSKPKSSNTRATQKLELIHSDLCGPFPVPSYGNSLYYISFIDDKTRVTWVRFLKKKSDTAQAIEDFVKEMELQHSLPVKRFRTDNGGEYVNKILLTFFANKGIVHELTPPYSPESNGVAERLNRTIGEAVRAMILPIGDKRLWADAVATFIYIKNRQPHSSVKNQTPYECFHDIKPKIHHLQPFGRECYVHIPENKRSAGSKLSPRAIRGIFTGYTNVDHHYRVFLTEEKRSVISGDVFFPPLKPEGAQLTSKIPIKHVVRTTPNTSLSYKETEGFPTDEMWLNWMDRNPETANTWFQKGHPKVTTLFQQAYENGKRDGFLGPQYWDFQNPAFSTQSSNDDDLYVNPNANPNNIPASPPPSAMELDSLVGSLRLSQAEQSDPMSEVSHHPQLPLDESLPSFHSSFQPPRTRYGREVHPPREWWIVPQLPIPPPASSEQGSNLPDAEQRLIEESSSEDTILVSVLEINEPKTYRQAVNSADSDKWTQAMNEELQSLKENEVWDVVDKPLHRNIVDSKWVFKVKGDATGQVERYKARLVAKGFSQEHGLDYDEVFSPVVRFDSLRLLLAITAIKGWRVRQLDVKTAFLYGILNKEIYMQLPEGSRTDNKVARLKRCIYGLKQSPREWYSRLVTYLQPYGFSSSAFDPCVLTHSSGEIFLAIYVDDITLFGPDNDLVEQSVQLMKSEFKVNDMGSLNYLLGIQIEYNKDGIFLSQTAFIDKILSRFSMSDCNPVTTPIDPNHRLMKACDNDERVNATEYRQIIGSLMYCVTATRPDLAYTITHLSQFCSEPTKVHLNAAKRVLRYLKGTRNRKLFYPTGTSLHLSAYTDASHGNCLDTRRSFSGYLIQLGQSTISWCSRKQKSVATSTCEAEYMALAMTAKHYLWLIRAINELLKTSIPHALLCDSNSADDIARNPKLNDRSKHIDISYHFVRELVEDGTINLLHVASADNFADICTKGLPRQTHDHLCSYIFTNTTK